MRGRGYIYSIIILLADVLLTPFVGGILALIAVIYALVLGEWLGRQKMGAIACDSLSGRNKQKLSSCFERVKTKVEQESKHVSKRVKVYYIPSDEINAYAFGWRSIGVTAGTLNLDNKTVETLIAHEYGHLVNGDAVLNMVLMVNALGIVTILASYQFVFLVMIYLFILFAYLIGMMRFSFLSYFISNKIIEGIRAVGNFFRLVVLRLCEILICLVGRKGELLADGYACKLGYGFYLQNFLTRYAQDRQIHGFIDVLYRTHPAKELRIANLSRVLERRQIG